MPAGSTQIAWGPGISVDVGGALGYLKGAISVGLDGETAWADVDQEIAPVDAKYTKKQLVAKFTLAEVTMAALGIAWDIAAPTTALDTFSAVPTIRTIILKGEGATAAVRTWTLYGGVSCDFGEVSYEKGNIVVLPVTFRFIKATGQTAATAVDAAS
jgi:hypothetical protein